jgi:hypothetical protein
MKRLNEVYQKSIMEHPHEGVSMNFDDYEGRMVKQNLFKLNKYSQEMFNSIHDYQEVESWIQEKIAIASDYISTVKHYLEYEMHYPGDNNAFEDDEEMYEHVHSIDDILPAIKRSMKENSSFKFRTKDSHEIIVNSRLSKNIYETYLKLNEHNREKFSNNLIDSKNSFWKVASFATA